MEVNIRTYGIIKSESVVSGCGSLGGIIGELIGSNSSVGVGPVGEVESVGLSDVKFVGLLEFLVAGNVYSCKMEWLHQYETDRHQRDGGTLH